MFKIARIFSKSFTLKTTLLLVAVCAIGFAFLHNEMRKEHLELTNELFLSQFGKISVRDTSIAVTDSAWLKAKRAASRMYSELMAIPSRMSGAKQDCWSNVREAETVLSELKKLDLSPLYEKNVKAGATKRKLDPLTAKKWFEADRRLKELTSLREQHDTIIAIKSLTISLLPRPLWQDGKFTRSLDPITRKKLLDTIIQLQDLRHLSIEGLRGDELHLLLNLPRLEFLSISGTDANIAQVDQLAQLPLLKTLYVDGARMRDDAVKLLTTWWRTNGKSKLNDGMSYALSWNTDYTWPYHLSLGGLEDKPDATDEQFNFAGGFSIGRKCNVDDWSPLTPRRSSPALTLEQLQTVPSEELAYSLQGDWKELSVDGRLRRFRNIEFLEINFQDQLINDDFWQALASLPYLRRVDIESGRLESGVSTIALNRSIQSLNFRNCDFGTSLKRIFMASECRPRNVTLRNCKFASEDFCELTGSNFLHGCTDFCLTGPITPEMMGVMPKILPAVEFLELGDGMSEEMFGKLPHFPNLVELRVHLDDQFTATRWEGVLQHKNLESFGLDTTAQYDPRQLLELAALPLLKPRGMDCPLELSEAEALQLAREFHERQGTLEEFLTEQEERH